MWVNVVNAVNRRFWKYLQGQYIQGGSNGIRLVASIMGAMQVAHCHACYMSAKEMNNNLSHTSFGKRERVKHLF